MKSWKTTLGGVITALATLSTSSDKTLHAIGIVCAIVGPLIIGASAKDVNVTGVGDAATTKKELKEAGLPV